jgi:CheY-like chemotaxis protein/HPt (histidine-containing phosphotransfer) domain-containing protein
MAAAAVFDARVDKPVRQHELLDCIIRVYGSRVDGATAAPVKQNAPRQLHAVTVRPLNILLAEDNKINQQFATALLEKAGHSVTIVENGHQAVDAVRRADYDVILMDIQMPEFDGIGATREIRAMPPPKCIVPIIAMTANAMPGARAEYLKAGMDDYIPKPVEVSTLFAKLAHVAKIRALKNQRAGKHSQDDSRDVSDADAPARQEAADVPILDREKLTGLQTVLSAPAAHEFAVLYLADADFRVAHIEGLAQCNDLAGISQEAHVLVGTAGNVGAMRVSALAGELENACRNNDHRSARALAGRIKVAHIATSSAFHGWLDGTGAKDTASAVQ